MKSICIILILFPFFTISAFCFAAENIELPKMLVHKAKSFSPHVENTKKDEVKEEGIAPVKLASRTLDIGDSTKMKFVRIPAGMFTMGSKKGKYDGKPIHKVSLTRPLYVSVYEVTRRQFAEFVEDAGYKTEAETSDGAYMWKEGKLEKDKSASWKNPGFKQSDDDPVVCVSWNDAVKFCEWLSKKEGVAYRLPTEAEWEYACRAGRQTEYYWGDSFDNRYEWYSENSDSKTHKVGQKRPNKWGLYDMSGNVFEWCNDWYKERYIEDQDINPTGPSGGEYRVYRGGSWLHVLECCHSAYRNYTLPTQRYSIIGFRVCCYTSHEK